MKPWNNRVLSVCLATILVLSASGCQGKGADSHSAAVSDGQALSSEVTSENLESTSEMVQTYSDMLVHEPAVSPSDPDYYARALETEIYNFKVIRNVPTA